MSKIVKFDPLSPTSIQDAIDAIQDEKVWMLNKTREFVRSLTEAGIDCAKYMFAQSLYDGTNDVEVWFSDRTQASAVGAYRETAAVVATGRSVLFIEFGTGVFNDPYHPEAYEMDMARGEFGKRQGQEIEGWYYYGEPGSFGEKMKNGAVHTYGNPANMCMYNAKKEVAYEFAEIAKRVFKR